MTRKSMKVKDDLAFPNVMVLTVRRKRDGKVLARRAAHNIVVNYGRTWVRGLLGASSFQEAPDDSEEYPGKTGSAWTVDEAIQPPFNNYRLRYMALGSGGMFAPAGTFQESVHVNTLETPVAIDGVGDSIFLKEMLPSPDANDLEVFPTAYDFVARCVWDSEDISVDVADEIDVSEIMICTSQADPACTEGAPNLDNYPLGFPGIAAYNCFAPVTKTQDLVIEAFWYWRL